MDTDNNFLFQETLRTQEDKVLDCNKGKYWAKKKLFFVCCWFLLWQPCDTCNCNRPARSTCDFDHFLLQHSTQFWFCSISTFFGTPSRVYPPQLLLNQNCLPLFHLQIFMCSTLRLKKPFSNSSAKIFCRKPSRVDKRNSNFFSPIFWWQASTEGCHSSWWKHHSFFSSIGSLKAYAENIL